MELLTKITSIILAPVFAFGTLFVPADYTTLQERVAELESQVNETELGRTVNAIGGNVYYLSGGGVSASASTLTLTSFKIPVSNQNYAMADFGDGVNAKGYLTLEPGSQTRQEFVSFTGLTQNADGSATLSGVTRGLLPIPPYTASTTYAKAHSGGTTVVISNPPQLYEAIYSYVDNATSSGAVDSSTIAKGIVEVASAVEAASTTQIGFGNTTAPLVLTTLLSTSTSPGSGNWIPVTTSGKINGNFCCSGAVSISGTTTFATTTFTGPVTFTASSTIGYPVAINNSTASTTIFQTNIPAYTLGTANTVRAKVYYSTNRVGNTGTNKYITVGYGGASTTQQYTYPTGGLSFDGVIDVLLAPNNSETSQLVTIYDQIASGTPNGWRPNASSTSALIQNTTYVDSRVNRPFTIEYKSEATAIDEFFRVRLVTMEVLR